MKKKGIAIKKRISASSFCNVHTGAFGVVEKVGSLFAGQPAHLSVTLERHDRSLGFFFGTRRSIPYYSVAAAVVIA